MRRAALLRFVELLLRQVVKEDSLVRLQKMAKVVVQEMARPDISWYGLDACEAEVAKKVMQELGRVPLFMVRLISQLLESKKTKVDVGVQTGKGSG